jgi:hypothetical protein
VSVGDDKDVEPQGAPAKLPVAFSARSVFYERPPVPDSWSGGKPHRHDAELPLARDSG